MRFGEIYSTCKNIYNDIAEDFYTFKDCYIEVMDLVNKNGTPHQLNGATNSIIKAIDRIRVELKKYEGNEVFNSLILEKNTINSIFEEYDGLYKNTINSIFKENPNLEKLKITFDRVEKLILKIQIVMRLGESIGMQQNELGLDIKMPSTENITDFKKYVDDLEFIFTKCPFFYSDEENLKFKNVDIGSVWLVLAVTGASIAIGSVLLNNIVAFIDKCYIVKSHKLTLEQQKKEIERSKKNQEQKEKIIKILDEACQISIQNAIDDLEEITKIEIKDNDERDRVEQSFNRLEKLIDKGLQIHAAIDSPKEVKALFAPIEMRYLSINDKISKIEDKSDEQ